MTPRQSGVHSPIDTNIAAEVLHGQCNCAPISKRGAAQGSANACSGIRRRNNPDLGACCVRHRQMALSVIKDATKQLARRWSSTPLRQQGKIGYILAWLIGVPIPI